MFDEKKNPKATKVMCPKCKTVQNVNNAMNADAPPPFEEESDFGWLRPRETPKVVSSPVISSPVIDPESEPLPSFMEDFRPQKKKESPPVLPKPPSQRLRTADSEQAGWLIIHDENTESYTFELRKGINRIGRASNTTSRDVNIMIKTSDKYMSRHHCDIQIRWHPEKTVFEYFLTDKNSSNGTFVNAGKRLTPEREVLINDGDTIQVGRTKLVLKLPSFVSDVRDAESRVREQDFFKTIIV